MLFSFTMEFEDREELEECKRLLLNRYSFTGEMSVWRDNDKWKMTAHSEKRFRDSTFEKLPGDRQDD